MDIHSFYSFFQARFRAQRMKRFDRYFREATGQRVLDIGGTPSIWRFSSSRFQVTLLNLQESDGRSEGSDLEYVSGDALTLPFSDNHFDIAFSNSVIEHVGGYAEQRVFAEEARRVAHRVWVQTPARWFPVEPHFLALCTHYLPKKWQPRIVRWCSIWGWLTRPSRELARNAVFTTRLLTKREMRQLFPDCRLLTERFCLLPKAYIAVR